MRTKTELKKAVRTPYGDLTVGDVFAPTDGSNYTVTVVDTDTYKDVEDVVIVGPNKVPHRIDWFKLMMVRYHKVETKKSA